MLDGTYFFECRCGSNEHTLQFTYDKEDHEIYTSVFLNDWLPWYKRIYRAVKYVLGYKCQYGHWDCWIMDENDIDRFREMMDRFEIDNEKDGLKNGN